MELDSDHSGSLGAPEVKELLKRMGEAKDAAAVRRAMLQMDPDCSGAVSKPQFGVWYRKQLENLVGAQRGWRHDGHRSIYEPYGSCDIPHE